MFHTSFSYSHLHEAANSLSKAAATTGKSEVSISRSEAEGLSMEIERLLMITEAMWEFIKEQHGYEDKDLFKKVLEIDAKDGIIDGKVASKGPVKCPECGHTLPRKKAMCIYCGAKVIKDVFER